MRRYSRTVSVGLTSRRRRGVVPSRKRISLRTTLAGPAGAFVARQPPITSRQGFGLCHAYVVSSVGTKRSRMQPVSRGCGRLFDLPYLLRQIGMQIMMILWAIAQNMEVDIVRAWPGAPPRDGTSVRRRGVAQVSRQWPCVSSNNGAAANPALPCNAATRRNRPFACGKRAVQASASFKQPSKSDGHRQDRCWLGVVGVRSRARGKTGDLVRHIRPTGNLTSPRPLARRLRNRTLQS